MKNNGYLETIINRTGQKRGNHMKEKTAVTVIGGADGPTSVFLAGKISGKKALKERFRQSIYRYNRKKAAKKISANPHTLRQVIAYANKKYHAQEMPTTHRRYQEEFISAKEALILKHKPKLLEHLAEFARPDVFDEEAAKEMFRQFELRREKVMHIPDSEMPMDFHVYEIRQKNVRIELDIDFRWDMFGYSCSGNKKTMKKMKKIMQELYLYYGVSGEDIRNKTERYMSLLAVLSSR